jgi:hypothetical protein
MRHFIWILNLAFWSNQWQCEFKVQASISWILNLESRMSLLAIESSDVRILPRFFWVPGVFSRDENSHRQKCWKYRLARFLKAFWQGFWTIYLRHWPESYYCIFLCQALVENQIKLKVSALSYMIEWCDLDRYPIQWHPELPGVASLCQLWPNPRIHGWENV